MPGSAWEVGTRIEEGIRICMVNRALKSFMEEEKQLRQLKQIKLEISRARSIW